MVYHWTWDTHGRGLLTELTLIRGKSVISILSVKFTLPSISVLSIYLFS